MGKRMTVAVVAGVAAVSAFVAWLVFDAAALATVVFILANLASGLCHVPL